MSAPLDIKDREAVIRVAHIFLDRGWISYGNGLSLKAGDLHDLAFLAKHSEEIPEEESYLADEVEKS